MLEFIKKEDEPNNLVLHKSESQQQQQGPQQSSQQLQHNNSSSTTNKSNVNSNYHVCQACKIQITSRFLFKMFSCTEDTYFHEECLTCCMCNVQLNTTCFYRSDKLYCKFDYHRIFLNQNINSGGGGGGGGDRGPIINNLGSSISSSKCCSKCNELIQMNELVMKVEKSHIYHLHCFTCVICCTQLQKGDEFVLRGSQLFCRADYEKEQQQQQLFLYQAQQLSPRGDENNRPRDGRRGPKRPRTILTSTQRRQFKASFEVSPKPCRKVREGLAKETGLSVRVVQVWFQNQRAKMKKIQRKSGNSKPEDSSKENKDGKCKDDDDDNTSSDDDDDEELGSRSCYDTDSQHGPFTPSGIGGSGHSRNPNLPYSPDDYNSNDESFICSSEISFEEDSNTGLESSANEVAAAAGSSSGGGGILELHNSRPSSLSSSGNNNADPNLIYPHHHSHQHGSHHHHSSHHHPLHHPHPLPPGQGPPPGGPYPSSSSLHPQPPSSINPIDKLYLMQNSYFNNVNND